MMKEMISSIICRPQDATLVERGVDDEEKHGLVETKLVEKLDIEIGFWVGFGIRARSSSLGRPLFKLYSQTRFRHRF